MLYLSASKSYGLLRSVELIEPRARGRIPSGVHFRCEGG